MNLNTFWNIGLIVLGLLLLNPSYSISQQLESLERSVVIIHNNVEQQQGTGFIINIDSKLNEAYILTAAHVVNEEPNPIVIFFGSRSTNTRNSIIQQDKGIDLALLKVQFPSELSNELISLNFISNKYIFKGAEIKIIGIPVSTNDWSIISGSVQDVREGRIQFSGNIGKGTSGSPVIYNGKVAGLVVQAGNQNTGLPSEAVQSDLIVPWIGNLSPNDWIGQINSDEFQQALKKIIDDAPNDYVNIKGGLDHYRYDTIGDSHLHYKYYTSRITLPGFTEKNGTVCYCYSFSRQTGNYDDKPFVEIRYDIFWGYESEWALDNIDENYVKQVYNSIVNAFISNLSDSWEYEEIPGGTKEFSPRRLFTAKNKITKQKISLKYFFDIDYQARIHVGFSGECIKINNYTKLDKW